MQVGFAGRLHRFSGRGCPLHAEAAILERICALNEDASCHGIIVQTPIDACTEEGRLQSHDPSPFNEAISLAKDVDGVHPINCGRLAATAEGIGMGSRAGRPTFLPCTPLAVMHLLAHYSLDGLAGKRVTVLGRSPTVGLPMALLCNAADATVTLCHSLTPDVHLAARQADLLIAAVGRPALVRASWIKEGATVVDIGINHIPDDGGPAESGRRRLQGDVAFDEALAVAGAITPVPGGVGPMTVAMLVANVYKAAFGEALDAIAALDVLEDTTDGRARPAWQRKLTR